MQILNKLSRKLIAFQIFFRQLLSHVLRQGSTDYLNKFLFYNHALFIKAIEEIVRQHDVSARGKNVPAEAGVAEKTTFSQKRADALAMMAEHFIATATVDDENGGIQALAGHEHGDHCGCAHLPPPYLDNHCISMANAKRFSSDASFYTVLKGKYDDILNLSRKTRTVNSALSRALNLRDDSCRFPGCCTDKYFDFHHIQHWVSGNASEYLELESSHEVEAGANGPSIGTFSLLHIEFCGKFHP